MKPRTIQLLRATVLALLLPATSLLIATPSPAQAAESWCCESWRVAASDFCRSQGQVLTEFTCRELPSACDIQFNCS